MSNPVEQSEPNDIISRSDVAYAEFIEAVRVAVNALRCAQMADTEQYVRERLRDAGFPRLIGNIERAGVAAGVLEAFRP